MLHNLPTCVLQQPNTRQPNFAPQMHRIPWNHAQATRLMNVAVKLCEEILNFPCQIEQPASPMVSCTLMSSGSCCFSPLFFLKRLTCSRPGCTFLKFARYLLSPLMQLLSSTLVTDLPESLHVTLMPCIDPLTVLLCHCVCHNTVSDKLVCLQLLVTENQIYLPHARKCCYRLFIFRGCVGMPVPLTRPTQHSERLAIRLASTALILLPGPAYTKHVAGGSMADVSATTAAQFAH